MKMKNRIKLDNLTFEDFRNYASNPSLSRHEKVGFPDDYREGKEEAIFLDICNKTSHINSHKKTILEIGPGCSQIPLMLAKKCEENQHDLIFIDSGEMLSYLPDSSFIKKFSGEFPEVFKRHIDEFSEKIDLIIAYSVVQYVFTNGNLWDFLDHCLLLLADGGEIIFGDIPNISMRKRFFASDAGIDSHRKYIGRDEKPVVNFNTLEIGQMDDSVILSILSRARAQGFHAWIMPQSNFLPMSNRREDILIRKP